MVRLDHHLLFDAHGLLNGANVHRLKEMIFAYEQAVELHNRRWPGHEIYRIQSEARLRLYIRERQEKELKQKTFAAIKLAERAAARSTALADGYDRLEKRLAAWTCRLDDKTKKIA